MSAKKKNEGKYLQAPHLRIRVKGGEGGQGGLGRGREDWAGSEWVEEGGGGEGKGVGRWETGNLQ